ncbi:protein of unknown function [Georgfuchsia toluolica]|uniref:Uncharacterized protein n=1 Tax=Georgfuchsia toluolica TaxID=424218 RepID=A0A916NA12_9PROT|nr:protein of unknown function [Georgfuchsia toluolica]
MSGSREVEVVIAMDNPFVTSFPDSILNASVPKANIIELLTADLPAVCPLPSMPLWALRPRIFLDAVNEKEITCP